MHDANALYVQRIQVGSHFLLKGKVDRREVWGRKRQRRVGEAV